MYLTCTTAGVCIQREGLKRQWSSSCLSRRSVLFEGQVTRYLVSFRKVCEEENSLYYGRGSHATYYMQALTCSSSRVRCLREERPRR